MKRKISFRPIPLGVLLIGIIVINSSGVTATVPYINERVNLTPSGGQTAGGNVQDIPMVSQDGRYVAFNTTSNDIVAADTNNVPDVFVRDRKLGNTVRASVSSTGGQLARGAYGFRMSANGRYVLFSYNYSDIIPGATDGPWQLYIRDLKNNTTELAILNLSGGVPANGLSSTDYVDISADGRYIVFPSSSPDLAASGTSGLYIRDRKLGVNELLVTDDGSGFGRPTISCDGSHVAFPSSSSTIVSGDTNGVNDVFLVDRINDTITNVTINGNGSSSAGILAISCNAETLVFGSAATNLVSGDTNNVVDIFAFNMLEDTVQRVNVDSSGNQGTQSARLERSSVDFSGRYVVFKTNSNLASNDTNASNVADVYLRDLVDGVTQVVSIKNNGSQSVWASAYQSMSLDGRYVVFNNREDFVGSTPNNAGNIYIAQTGI